MMPTCLPKKIPELRIRALYRSDLNDVLELYHQTDGCKLDLDAILQSRHCCWRVVHEVGRIVAFCLYLEQPDHLEVLELAVDERRLRMRYGQALIVDLIRKALREKRRWLFAEVCERNLGAQLWLRALGFVASDFLPEHHEGDGMIEFRFDLHSLDLAAFELCRPRL